MDRTIVCFIYVEGILTAVFPELTSSMNPLECVSYQHIGQHGSLHDSYLTTPYMTYALTTEQLDEINSLIIELKTMGYENLNVLFSWRTTDRDEWRKTRKLLLAELKTTK
jgi:hypothetical protein